MKKLTHFPWLPLASVKQTSTLVLASLVAIIFLAGCAQAQQAEATSPTPGETAAPNEAAPPPQDTPTTAPTVTATPAIAFTVVPLTEEIPKAFEAPKDTAMPQSPTGPAPSGSITTRWINQAVQDLANRLKVGEDAIQVLAFEPVVWPDGGLGCPEPGIQYTQVMVEGFRIRLQHNGQTYNYHGSMDRAPFLCEQ